MNAEEKREKVELLTSQNRALRLGLAAGIRSMTPPAAGSWATASGRIQFDGSTPFRLLANPWIERLLLCAAAGEIVADKIVPFPRRTAPALLFGRMAVGMVSGAAIAPQSKRSMVIGGLCGMGGAAVGSYAATHARARLTEAGLPDVLVAIGEDLVALSLAVPAVSRRAGTVA